MPGRKTPSRRQDNDLADMTPGALRRELMRLRRAIRAHRDTKNNARCWLNDVRLYDVLPENEPAGKMTDPEEVLLRNCRRYIRRQKCGHSEGS